MRPSISVFHVLLGLLPAFASASRVAPRSTRPSPISIAPSQNWDGDDGPWSSFSILLGSPAQNLRVFVSSILSNTWVVRSDSCTNSQASCEEDRGRTFDPKASTSWHQGGDYNLDTNQNIGPYLQGLHGNETLGLGLQGSGGLVLPSQGVVAYTSQDLNMGMFGANALSIDSNGRAKGQKSSLVSLKNRSMIPSLSFGYTAGNQYRLKKVYGSLTLGGYDSTLFRPNPLSFPFVGTDPSRYLQVAIQAVISKDQSGNARTLLPNPIMANVDSTESMIWLPTEACEAFEATFGLTWDPETNLYLVDDDLHNQLQEQNASVTFSLSNQTTGGVKADIVLPYDAFDLFVKPPYAGVDSNQRYFPLQRAVNDSQYTLGRTFLQEAYLTVDWDRRNFSVSQCNFTDYPSPNLVAIYSPGEAPKHTLSAGTKVGIAVAAVVGFLLLAALVGFLILRRRRARRRAAEEAARSGINPKEGMIRQGFAKGEMGAGIENARYEMEGSDGNALKPYGGAQPPWVDEKARYPGLGSPEVVEIDGLGEQQQRAELHGAIGFYGGRGVHEMYDPSSVPPIELPSSKAEGTFHCEELDGSSSGAASPRTPRSPLSQSSSSGKPSFMRSSFFAAFSRRSRAQSGATEQSSSGISGPSVPSSPKEAERAFGSRGRAHLVSIHRSSGRSAPSNHSQSQALDTFEVPPPLPNRDLSSLGRQYNRSDPVALSDYTVPSPPSSVRSPNSRAHSFNRADLSESSNRQRSLGLSAPSSQRSRHGSGALTQNRYESGVPVPSRSSNMASRTSITEIFSPITRMGTDDVMSSVSPDEDERSDEYLGGVSRIR